MDKTTKSVNGIPGKMYLREYFVKSNPLLKQFLREKVAKSEQNGDLPREIVSKFADIAVKGKRIRGSLMTLGYQLFGGAYDKRIIKTSLLVEIAHTAILVQDDLMDRADTRRGVVTHHKYFEKIAEGKGFAYPANFSRALSMDSFMAGHYFSWDLLLNSGYSYDRIIKAGKSFSNYIQRLADGQSLDIAGLYMGEFNKNYILNVLKLKTAEYTGEMPLVIGAQLAGAREGVRLNALRQYGLELGWAFQIQDDILGMFGDEEEVGKPIDSDLAEGKKTLLMLHLHQNGTSEEKVFQKRMLGKNNLTKAEIEKMKEILKKRGSYDYVVAEGWKHVEKGKRHISQITRDKKMADLLESLIVYMMERTL